MKPQHTLTPVDRNDLPKSMQFQAHLTDHPIICDEQGTVRYQSNRLIEWLREYVNINEMQLAYRRGEWSREQFMQFYRDIGYSLAGFEEVWGDELKKIKRKQARQRKAAAKEQNSGN